MVKTYGTKSQGYEEHALQHVGIGGHAACIFCVRPQPAVQKWANEQSLYLGDSQDDKPTNQPTSSQGKPGFGCKSLPVAFCWKSQSITRMIRTIANKRRVETRSRPELSNFPRPRPRTILLDLFLPCCCLPFVIHRWAPHSSSTTRLLLLPFLR